MHDRDENGNDVKDLLTSNVTGKFCNLGRW